MKRILVAEDNPVIRSLIVEFLTEEGYGVVATGDGASAIAMARDRRPDLIVMDLMMPVINGMAATRALKGRRETRSIPVIAISAGPNLRAHADLLPADRAVVKPFDLDTLAAAIGDLLGDVAGEAEAAA
jgi:CheY-like chemotaxis protein